jgi:hypothetical protein
MWNYATRLEQLLLQEQKVCFMVTSFSHIYFTSTDTISFGNGCACATAQGGIEAELAAGGKHA